MRPTLTMAKSKLPLILTMIAIFVIASGCHREGSYRAITPIDDPVQGAIAQGPIVMAVYVPWFGGPQHIKGGYTTDDPAALRRQIARAKELGVQVFAVDWYGERRALLYTSDRRSDEIA